MSSLESKVKEEVKDLAKAKNAADEKKVLVQWVEFAVMRLGLMHVITCLQDEAKAIARKAEADKDKAAAQAKIVQAKQEEVKKTALAVAEKTRALKALEDEV